MWARWYKYFQCHIGFVTLGGTFNIARAVKYKLFVSYSIVEFTKIQSLMASLFQQFSCILYLILGKTDRTRAVVTSMAGTAIPHFCCCLLSLILKKTAHIHYSLTIHVQWLKTLMIVEQVQRAWVELPPWPQSTAEEYISDLPLELFQPKHITIPHHSFSVTTPVSHSFQAMWFNKFGWLSYGLDKDAAHCFTCCKVVKNERGVITGVTDRAFIVRGSTNWKYTTRSFSKHESSDFHKVWSTALTCRVDIDMLSQQAASRKWVSTYWSVINSSLLCLSRTLSERWWEWRRH